MVTSTLDDGDGSRVAHTESLTHLSVDVEFTRGGTIQPRVTGNDIFLGFKVFTVTGGRQDADAPAAKPLAEVVVTFALEFEVESVNGKCSERLACRAFELDVDSAVGQASLTVFLAMTPLSIVVTARSVFLMA
jgi:hypothetical protein